MAAAFNPSFSAARQPVYNAQTVASAPAVPAGTFIPGTKVQVGSHRVVIEKYLSEGGFAHVYLVRLPKPISGDDSAVLKRVAVPDREALSNMRTEVETMKQLKGQRYIVTYIDSHASQLKGGGYEVFLLMEYCNGGGLIDFMNTRLQNRLTEPEVLKIFLDSALGVACMHYLKPPLLHRDLKVENILIASSGSSRKYKLCDFGSAAPPRPAATNAVEGRLIEDDVQKHTTLQYRSPEMIDVYRNQPIDEKSDIWALGVLLYKLCYYKTPFEEQGQNAILNASFKFPGYPSFSDNLKKLIATMLQENPQSRPNIYQIIRQVCLMCNCDIPIRDIYAGRTQSEARRNQKLPSHDPQISSPRVVGAYKAPPIEEQASIPDIVPMRRGRPAKTDRSNKTPKPNHSPLRAVNGDPFLALDSQVPSLPLQVSLDEATTRFPAIDDFSIFHESGGKVAFDAKLENQKKPPKDISQRVTDALADDAFARPSTSTKSESEPQSTSARAIPGARSSLEIRNPPKVHAPISRSFEDSHPVKMVSTGTMTSPTLPPSLEVRSSKSQSRPTLRLSSPGPRASSQPRPSNAASINTSRPGLLNLRSRSQIGAIGRSRSPTLSAQTVDVRDSFTADLNRSKSATEKTRPSSMQLEPKQRSLKSRAQSKETLITSEADALSTADAGAPDFEQEATRIYSNVDFLKAMEEVEPSKKKEKRLSGGSKHIKRASMPSISLSGTKSLLAGRFGDAFRRFETNTNDSGPTSPGFSPERDGSHLTPIAGSEATDGRSDDGHSYEETEIPPEMRRELERRRLSQEEKRVAQAGAAYKQQLAEGDGDQDPSDRSHVVSKAASIQSRVKTLLDESGRASPSPTQIPQGYDRFISSPEPLTARPQQTDRSINLVSPPIPSKPLQTDPPFNVPLRKGSLPAHLLTARTHPEANVEKDSSSHSSSVAEILSSTSRSPQVPVVTPSPAASRPSAPPKPRALRTGTHSPIGRLPPPSQSYKSPLAVNKPPPQPRQSQPSLHASGQLQKNSNPYQSHLREPRSQQLQQTRGISMDAKYVDGGADVVDDDWEANFSKRYPTLAGLEMVETEIEGRRKEMSIKDV